MHPSPWWKSLPAQVLGIVLAGAVVVLAIRASHRHPSDSTLVGAGATTTTIEEPATSTTEAATAVPATSTPDVGSRPRLRRGQLGCAGTTERDAATRAAPGRDRASSPDPAAPPPSD